MRIGRRRLLLGTMGGAGIAATLKWSPGRAQAKYLGRISVNQPAVTVLVQGMLKLAEMVSQRTDGAVVLRVFPDAQLGSDPQALDQMKLGSLEAALPNASNLTQFVPDFAVTDLPFLFRSSEHAQKAVAVIQKQFKSKLIAAGFYPLGGMNYGVRDMCSIDPITNLSEMQGKKIRVIQSPTIVKAWKLLGANPTPIASAEVYMALQTRLIDCAEFPPSSFVAFKRYEVAKHWTQIGYLYSFQYLLISNQWVKKLPPKYVDIMQATMEELSPTMFLASEKEEAEALDKAKQFGCTIHQLSDRPMWVKRLDPMFDEYASKTPGGKQLLDELRAIT